jgi:hypothetical protein
MSDQAHMPELAPTRRWLVVFTHGNATWSGHVTGSYADAYDYAASLCYEAGTRFTIREHPDLRPSTGSQETDASLPQKP